MSKILRVNMTDLETSFEETPEFMRYEPLPPHNQVWDVPDKALDSVWNF
ncbi:MAG: hypothetical protein U5R49_04560 [Deltaproteobacteria bacterium]|nr:hypothetical protein [Deltaproteobacteria bacterium]